MNDHDVAARAAAEIRSALAASELEHTEFRPGVFEVTLPGTRKLTTTCRLEVGDHALGIHAFVARRPDENHEAVYRWMLERNLRMYAVAFAVDSAGDIYLDGRMPLHAVDADEIDRILGSVLTYSDDSFNTLLELGFATSIKREWDWRISRGESTRNLEAFRHLLEREPSD
ncbi:putative sensory transduction regulator [Mumia flava]|uniref:Putative sensory transduction regulator n=1 Tax=Mumia flava TaxID=1348852 RepID=A0A0B2BTN2_9ACTN|nr:YbjN domain-containing protein [Mumia flava]PJJ57117.1 putative sensory transduction regulator [Mumia flava]